MARSIRRTANIAVLFLLTGCAEILGTRDSVDVDVLADLRPDNRVVLTVRNNERHAIRLNASPCSLRMERRERGEWVDPSADIACPAVLILTRIEPGEVHTALDWDTTDWEPGEYRFRVSFVHRDEEKALPGSPRASNAFRIERVMPLAKAQGWRDPDWHRDPHLDAVLEIAPDRSTAEVAWRENVPDTLSAGSSDYGPGVYGELDQVNFDRQAVVVWSSSENSCPDWIVDLRTTDNGTVEVETETLSPDPPSDPNVGAICLDIYYPYRMVLAVDRDRLPDLGSLPSDSIGGFRSGVVATYPYETFRASVEH